MKKQTRIVLFMLVAIALVIGVIAADAGMWDSIAFAQGPKPTPPKRKAPAANPGTGFTYQGQLKQNGTPYNGTCEFQFGLWNDATVGTQQGVTQTVTTSVTSGLFMATLNDSSQFGTNAFDGNPRWLAIAVRCPTGSGNYTMLGSREQLTPAPYAFYSVMAGTVNYQNVLVVAKSGGNYAAITDALNSISDASDTNHYLIKVMPGVYTETVTMKQYVDIEGSGELMTKITQVGSATPATGGTVIGANNAELRFLSVVNTGGNSFAIAINNTSASPHLTQVTTTASGGTNTSTGVRNAFSSSSIMTNVTANALGGGVNSYGVFNNSASPTMTNIIANASGGTENYGVYNNNSSSPKMSNVTANASGGTDNYGVFNYSSSSPTMSDVIANASGGTYNSGVFNSSSASPTMSGVTASASGGTDNRGVYNASASPTMMNVTANASGGTYSYGVNNTSSSPMMTNVTVNAFGGSYNFGLYNDSSSPTIQNSVIIANSGTSRGIFNMASSGTYTVTINNSQIQGSSNTISNNAYFTTFVGVSKLDGGAVTGAGTITCAGVYDESYIFYASTCP